MNTDLKTDFAGLNIPVPENIYKKPLETQKKIYGYMSSLNDIQKSAYTIAYNHLGSSFDILKSIGYIEWLQKMAT